MPEPIPIAHLQPLLERIDNQLLPQLRLHSHDPHEPVTVLSAPQPWLLLGCGNDAAVLHHPLHPDLVVKVYAPGRPGLVEEAEVYRRIGDHPAFSRCWHVGDGFLVLERLHGTTFYDCLRLGIRIPPRVIADVDAVLVHAASCGLNGHDVHGRNVMLH